jgi:hypothetical protein
MNRKGRRTAGPAIRAAMPTRDRSREIAEFMIGKLQAFVDRTAPALKN